MAWIDRGNLKGPAGTFHSASAVTLPAEAPATVTMGGTLADRTVQFGIPRGLPGVNAVPADEAVAAYIRAETPTETNTAIADYVSSRVGSTVVDAKVLAPEIDFTGTVASDAAWDALTDELEAGVTLTLPPNAEIRFDSARTLTKPVHIYGHGATFRTTNATGIFIVKPSASGSSFRNFTMEGVTDLGMVAADKGMFFDGEPGFWVENITVEDVTATKFGYGGFYGSHIRNSVFRDCKVTNSVYCGFQFLSPDTVTLYNPIVDGLAGDLRNGNMQSYPIAWTRDQTKESITDYPNAIHCTTWGGIIRNTGWEGVDTHGGRDIRTIGTTILGCQNGVAYVPCPDTSGADLYPPIDCVVAFCTIDGQVSDGSKSSGIKLVGAGTASNVIASASGKIIGNTIKNHGPGKLVGGASADPNNVAAGIQVYLTDGAFIDGNTIINPSPYGIALYHNNKNCQIGENLVVDAWSTGWSQPAAVGLRSARNHVQLGAVKIARGSKSAPIVNASGVHISNTTDTFLTLSGGHNFDEATTDFSGGGGGTIRHTGMVESGIGGAIPTSGVWKRGAQWLQANVVAGGSPGWVCVSAGGGTSASRLNSTAYTAGQWVSTASGLVLECLVAGTSGAAGPTYPSTIGTTFTDGTVTWILRATALAAWKPLPNLGA